MSSMPSPTQSNSAGRRTTEPLIPTDMKNEWLPSERRSPGRLASRALVGFLIAFCIGVAATLAWQSYGEVARETIASSSPQLGWLAPQAVPVAQTAPDMIAPVAPVDPSPDQQRLEAMSLDLSAMRQSVDHLAASLEQTMRSVDQLAAGQERLTRTVNQLTASQEQMTRDITKLQAAEQNILHKLISTPSARPAAAPTRKPAPPTPQAPPVDSVQ